MRFFALAMLMLLLALPASAGVYVTDQPDGGNTFCQAVANTRAAYCPRMKADCRTANKKKATFLIALARKCNTPTVISEKDAARGLSEHSRYQAVLCCPDNPPKKKSRRHHS